VTANGQAGGIPVTAFLSTGHSRPLTITRIDKALTAAGIDADVGDVDGEQVSAPEDWVWAQTTCPYVTAMIDGWATDTLTERNPMAASGFVRLFGAYRLGCIAEADFARGRQTLIDRHARLCASQEPVRKVRPHELGDWEALGRKRASTKTEEAIRSTDLGGHTHEGSNPGGSQGASFGSPSSPSSPSSEDPDVVPRLWEATDLQPATQPRWLAKGRLQRGPGQFPPLPIWHSWCRKKTPRPGGAFLL
jgi:hypothetical protein